MLADIATSLRAWLTSELSPGTEIGFDSPALLTTVGRRPRHAAILNLFLYGVNENLSGMPAQQVRMRTAEGKVAGTLAPIRSYFLSYLVTAWGADTAEEMELLGAVIDAHAEQDCLAVEFLYGSLGILDRALPVRIGWSPVNRGEDMWGSLGLPMRAALDMTVDVPVVPSRLRNVAPPVQAVDVDLHDMVHEDREPNPPRQRLRRAAVPEA